MKHLENTTSRSALLAVVLLSAVAMAFPINIKQDKTSQDANVEAAKRFVGTWKGKSRPDMIADDVLIFKMDGERLRGTERQLHIRNEGEGRGPEIFRDEYVAMPVQSIGGMTVTWSKK